MDGNRVENVELWKWIQFQEDWCTIDFCWVLLNILPKTPQVIDPLLFFKQPLDIYLKLAIYLLMDYLEMDRTLNFALS